MRDINNRMEHQNNGFDIEEVHQCINKYHMKAPRFT